MRICEMCKQPKNIPFPEKYCEGCKEDIELLGFEKAKNYTKKGD